VGWVANGNNEDAFRLKGFRNLCSEDSTCTIFHDFNLTKIICELTSRPLPNASALRNVMEAILALLKRELTGEASKAALLREELAADAELPLDDISLIHIFFHGEEISYLDDLPAGCSKESISYSISDVHWQDVVDMWPLMQFDRHRELIREVIALSKRRIPTSSDWGNTAEFAVLIESIDLMLWHEFWTSSQRSARFN